MPLPSCSNKVTLGDLVVDRARHSAALPKEFRDLLLLLGILHRILSVANIMCDVRRSKKLVHGRHISREPNLFIKSARKSFVLFLDLTGTCRTRDQKQRQSEYGKE